MKTLTVTVPGLKIQSEMNARSHWTVRRKRFSAQAALVLLSLQGHQRGPLLRCKRLVIRLVRIGGRRMDRDNLAGGFKAVLDTVCKWLSLDDGDESRLPVIEWAQEIGPTGIRIEITEAP